MKKQEMTAPKLTDAITKFWQAAIRIIHQLDEQTHGWLGILAGAADQTLKPNSAITAAAIAYFAILSLFPLTLLSIAIASYSLGPSMDQQLIIQRLEFIAPALGQLLGKNIDEIITARGPVTGAALIGLVWSASTVFNTFTHTLNEIWGVKRRRAVWKRRGTAILFVLAFVGPLLFLTSFASSIMSSLLIWLPVRIIPVVSALSLILAILLDVALFMVLYIMLPHELPPGARFYPVPLAPACFGKLPRKPFYFLLLLISLPRTWSMVQWQPLSPF